MMAASVGTVKAVFSGDTIVVVGKAVGNVPPQEITLTLASIQAPRISRGPAQNVEEPYGWECRELLRKLCIGKTVSFRIIYCISAQNKNYADVELAGMKGESSLSKLVVEAGLATVTPVITEGKMSAYHTDLLTLEEEAKEVGMGMFATGAALSIYRLREVNWTPSTSEVEEIFNKCKGKPVTVVVEHVRDGASMRVLMLDTMTFLSFSLAGITAPRIAASSSSSSNRNTSKDMQSPSTIAAAAASSNNNSSSNGSRSPAPLAGVSEPFALQARHFTELRLLHREVEVIMFAMERNGGVLGGVVHPKGNISVEIVRAGLARVQDRSLNTVPKDTVLALRVAEREALTNHRFIWSTTTTTTTALSSSSSLMGTEESSSIDGIHPNNSSSGDVRGLPHQSPNNRPSSSSSSFSSANIPMVTPGRAGTATGGGTGGAMNFSSSSSGLKQFEGVVMEVISGDTFLVLEDDNNNNNNSNSSSLVAASELPSSSSSSLPSLNAQSPLERRVTLSSIRAPRVGNSKGVGYEIWANECRDCLRARLIGRRVLVIVDYEKPLAATLYSASSASAAASGIAGGNERSFGHGPVDLSLSPAPGQGLGQGQGNQTVMRYFATVKALPSYRNVALMLLQEGLVTCSTRVTLTTAVASPIRPPAISPLSLSPSSHGRTLSSSLPSPVPSPTPHGHLVSPEYSCEFESAGYLIAEAEAAAAGRGLHGSAPPPGTLITSNNPKVIDFSMDAKKSKAFVTQLLAKAAAAATPPPSPHSSQKTMLERIMVPIGGTPYPPPPALSTPPSALRPPPLSLTFPPTPASSSLTSLGPCSYRGVVEFVHSGSRIKVLIPSETCVLSMTLAQIRCPLPARAASNNTHKPAEPFSDEARAFSRRHVHQRSVVVRIDDVDKNGIAMGRLYLQVPMAPPPGIPTTPGGGPPNKQQGRQGRGPGKSNNNNNNNSSNGNNSSGKGNHSQNAVTASSPSSSSSSSSTPHPSMTMASKPYALMLVSEGLARVDRKFKPGIASLANDHGVTEKETQDLLVAQAIAMSAKKGIWSVPGNIEAEHELDHAANATPSLPPLEGFDCVDEKGVVIKSATAVISNASVGENSQREEGGIAEGEKAKAAGVEMMLNRLRPAALTIPSSVASSSMASSASVTPLLRSPSSSALAAVLGVGGSFNNNNNNNNSTTATTSNNNNNNTKVATTSNPTTTTTTATPIITSSTASRSSSGATTNSSMTLPKPTTHTTNLGPSLGPSLSAASASGLGLTYGPCLLTGEEERVVVRLTAVSSGTAFFVHVHTEERQAKLREIETLLAAFTPSISTSATSTSKKLLMPTTSEESVVPVTDPDNADADAVVVGEAEADVTDSTTKAVKDKEEGEVKNDNTVSGGGVVGNMSLIDELDTSIQRVRTLLTKQRQRQPPSDENNNNNNDADIAGATPTTSAPTTPKKSTATTSVPSSSSSWLQRGRLVLARVEGQKLVGGTVGEYKWYRARVEEGGEEGGGDDSNGGNSSSSSSGGDDILVTAKSRRQQVRVQCIDYGKRVVVDVGDLAVIDDDDDDDGGDRGRGEEGTTKDDGSGNGGGGNNVMSNSQHAKYFTIPGLAVECCLAFLAPPSSPPILDIDGQNDDEGHGGNGGNGDGGDGYTLAVDVDEDNGQGDDGSCVDADADALTGYRGMLAMSNRAIELLGDEAWGKDMLMQVLGKTRSTDTDSHKLLVALYEYSGGGGGGSCHDLHPDPHRQDPHHDNNTTLDLNSVSSRPRLRKIKSWSNTSSDDEEEDEDQDGRSETSRMDGQSYSRARSVDGDSVAETHCSLKTFNTVETYNTNNTSTNVSKVHVNHPKPALSHKDKDKDKSSDKTSDKGLGQVSPWGTKFTWGSSLSLNTQAITVSSFLNCNHNDNPLGLDEDDYPLPVSSRALSRNVSESSLVSTEVSLSGGISLGDIIAAEERMLTRLEPKSANPSNNNHNNNNTSNTSNASMLLETKGGNNNNNNNNNNSNSNKRPSGGPREMGGGSGGSHPWLVTASALTTAATTANTTKLSSSSSSSSSLGGHLTPSPPPPPTTMSVNEKMLRAGLARVSRTATRLLPRQAPLSTGKQRGIGYGRPPATLSPLATTLYEQILEAELCVRRAHLNLYKYGDPPDTDDEREREEDNIDSRR